MINQIISVINLEKVIISRHAKEEAENDDLPLEDIIFSVMNGKIIENYPDDFPFPSCLVFGTNQNQEPIHSVWAYNKNTGFAVLITVYRPDFNMWIEWRIRKNNNN